MTDDELVELLYEAMIEEIGAGAEEWRKVWIRRFNSRPPDEAFIVNVPRGYTLGDHPLRTSLLTLSAELR